ncbi:hypothetical protein BDV06DRAFT_225657 [Aspergillus oleicola]
MPDLSPEEEQKIWEDAAKSAKLSVEQGTMAQEDADKWESAAAQKRKDNDSSGAKDEDGEK